MYISKDVPDKPPVKLLPQRTYNFEVINAEDTTSKSGNEMIKLTLKVWDHTGDEHIIWDYLIDIDHLETKIKGAQ